MYRCQRCKSQSKVGEKQIKVTSETRKKTYENHIRKGKKVFTIKSEGFEIVKELKLCTACSQTQAA